MRTLTLARMGRALMIAAAMIMLPQLASAQLPIETRELLLQGAVGSVTLKAEGQAGAGTYTLTMPATLTAGTGALLYTNDATGGLSWTNQGTNGYVLKFKDGAISWVDPTTDTENPNWAIGGNTFDGGGAYSFGTKSADGVNIQTGNTTRIGIAAGGDITISNQTTFDTGADPDLVVTESTISRGGAIAINPGTTNDITTDGGITSAENITITSGGLTVTAGGADVTGALTLGASSPINVGGSDGTSGFALISQGGGATPAWQSINDAVGIRESGTADITNAASVTVSNVSGLRSGDAIIVTIEGTSSVVVANVTTRNADTGVAPAVNGDGSFTVSLSAVVANGKLNYMVLKAQ